MAYTKPLDSFPIVGKEWNLHFGWKPSTGGIPDSNGSSPNFTCASAVMWNINFVRKKDNYNAYSHLGESPVPISDRYDLYKKLVDRFDVNTFMVQMVGVVNGGTEARLKHYLQSENKCGYHTYDFCNWLIENKIGVVVESPIFVNTYHKWEGPSICQAWFWFSPSILKQKALVEFTGGIHGLDTCPGFLHDSEINKKDTAKWKGLVAKSLVDPPRFKKAKEHWEKIAEDRGHLTKIDEHQILSKNIWSKTGTF